ncbi:MAG TPA: class I SAM-dependent methyltransferase [Gammaproteobacteria bacterium]|nr:class I SAM-dependent methyltransferase [Gammaproteobacteria bacterium]
MDADAYEAWYHSPRGRWIGETEFALLMQLLPFSLNRRTPDSVLDVGCGTGYFTRHFAAAGLQTSGLDPDAAALAYAMKKDTESTYLQGTAEALPFVDNSFTYCSAITSLCFVAEPEKAVLEMWRLAHRGILLGLLNRRSLLYRQKQGRGAYRGARWDTLEDVKKWVEDLSPRPAELKSATAVFLPGASVGAQILERLLPASLPWGSFLAVYIKKSSVV